MEQIRSWLPQTKFQPPRLRDDISARPRVLSLLTTAVASSSITLIAAPAGYGKTTLVASWLAELQGNTSSVHPASFTLHPSRVAWLSLDPEDDDPQIFLSGMLAALQRLNPDFGTSVHSMLRESGSEPARLLHLIGLLINDILDALPQPFVLVLDDLHVLANRAIFTALDYLVEHQPDQMRLVILTREDPPLSLTRLRARQRLTELRLPELRFTLDEVVALLNNQLRLALPTEELRVLATHTEGWVAALRLLAGALATRSPNERATVIERLVHNNRHIFDLLAAEVLNLQPLPIQGFLLTTSILDTLTPSLCAAVLADPDADALLHEVYRRNLFLIATDDSDSVDTTYRYHALFAAFLRRQLNSERPADVPVLHRRAATASQSPVQTIQHYLAAEDWDAAASAIQQIAGELFSGGQLTRLQSWVEMLPRETRAEHPWLAYYLGACGWGQSRWREARTFLEEALAGFASHNDVTGRGETLVLLATVHQTNGAFDVARELYMQARSLPISVRSQAQLQMGLAWLGLGDGDDDLVATSLPAALDLVERTGDEGARQVVVMQLRELFAMLPAGRAALGRLCQLALAEQAVAPTSLTACAHSIQAVLCFLRGQLDETVRQTNLALQQSAQLGNPPWLCNSLDFFSSIIYETGGQRVSADHAIARLRTTLDELPGWYAARAFALATISLSRGEMSAARAVEADIAAHADGSAWPASVFSRHLLRGLLALHERQFAQAEAALVEARTLQQSYRLCTMFGDVDFVLAAVYLRSRRPEAARRALQDALRRWRETNLPGMSLVLGARILTPVLEHALAEGIEVDWTARILDLLRATSTSQQRVITQTGSTLTPREMEVLTLLVRGVSNQAIADTLVVSLPTAKTHVARILDKLGVATRTEAAARARELGLL